MNRLTLQATLCSIGMVVEAVFLVVLEAVVCLAVEEEELSAWALELDFQVCAFTSSNALYVDIITRITLEALPSRYKYFSGGAVAGVAMMETYHRYKLYQSMMYYHSHGSYYGGGYGRN